MILNPTSSYRPLKSAISVSSPTHRSPHFYLAAAPMPHWNNSSRWSWPLLFLNLMDTFSPFYLTWWQPLLLPTTSLLKCSTAFISLIFDSRSHHGAISGGQFSFPLLVPLLELTVKGISGERLGGTAVLTMTVSIYLQLASVRSVCR